MAHPLTEKDVVVAPELPDVLPARKPLTGFRGYCRKNPAIAIGAGLLLVMLFMAIFAPLLWTVDPPPGDQSTHCRLSIAALVY